MAVARRQIVQKPTRIRDNFIQHVANLDKPSTRRVDEYSEFILALARKFTSSIEEAEAAKREIFTDILRYAHQSKAVPSHDEHLASLIARRRLSRYLA
jgi:hypothetical protein